MWETVKEYPTTSIFLVVSAAAFLFAAFDVVGLDELFLNKEINGGGVGGVSTAAVAALFALYAAHCEGEINHYKKHGFI